MKFYKGLIFLVLFLGYSRDSSSSSSQTYQGVVCLKFASCNYLLVCLNNGNYSIAEDIDTLCSEGDTLIAELKNLGEMNAQNLTKNTSCKIRVELWEYSKITSMQQLIRICKSAP